MQLKIFKYVMSISQICDEHLKYYKLFCRTNILFKFVMDIFLARNMDIFPFLYLLILIFLTVK